MIKDITFTLPAEVAGSANQALLLGDFNDWKTEDAIVLKKQKDGSLKGIAQLESGKSYQYRYLLDDGRWENDHNAQNYIHVDNYQVDNCLITVPEAAAEEKESKQVKSKVAVKSATKAKSTVKAKSAKTETVKPKAAKTAATKSKSVKPKAEKPKS